MDSSKEAEAVKAEVKVEEEVYCIDGDDTKPDVKPSLATVRPLKLEPVVNFGATQAEPAPSSSYMVAEVRFPAPPPPDQKFDPFDLSPRARFSPPPPPAFRAKRRSVPGGHASATPRLKFQPYQARR